MKINTTFSFNQKVYIKELKLVGKIVGIYISNITEYNIRYFYDSKVNTCYFLEDELESIEEKTKIGFESK